MTAHNNQGGSINLTAGDRGGCLADASNELTNNQILRALPEPDRRRLIDDLVPTILVQSTLLANPGEVLRHIVFPTGGVVSLVTGTSEGGSVEAVLIGNEGVVGSWHAAGVEGAPWRTIVQAGGPALLMTPEAFKAHVAESPALAQLVVRYNLAAHLLTSQSAACNRFHELAARAARWLLMVCDRTASLELTLTQEFLAQMLGAYRPSVTVALRGLDRAGLVAVSRSRIIILDRPGLEELACECYAVVRQQTADLVQSEGSI